MPYIVTTTRPLESDPAVWAGVIRNGRYESSLAVTELFDACEEAAHRIEQITGGDPDYEETYTAAQGCSELGETFGPLPGGAIVKVEPVLLSAVIAAVPEQVRAAWPESMPASEIIDAYNARQA